MLQGALHLLRDGGTEDAFQLPVHLTHPIGGGRVQCAQKHGCHNHVLAGPGEGEEMTLRTLNCNGPACLKRRLALVQVGQSGLNVCPLVSELAPSMCGFMLDVVLRGVLSSFLVGR
jgi:hypothetical protein